MWLRSWQKSAPPDSSARPLPSSITWMSFPISATKCCPASREWAYGSRKCDVTSDIRYYRLCYTPAHSVRVLLSGGDGYESNHAVFCVPRRVPACPYLYFCAGNKWASHQCHAVWKNPGYFGRQCRQSHGDYHQLCYRICQNRAKFG